MQNIQPNTFSAIFASRFPAAAKRVRAPNGTQCDLSKIASHRIGFGGDDAGYYFTSQAEYDRAEEAGAIWTVI